MRFSRVLFTRIPARFIAFAAGFTLAVGGAFLFGAGRPARAGVVPAAPPGHDLTGPTAPAAPQPPALPTTEELLERARRFEAEGRWGEAAREYEAAQAAAGTPALDEALERCRCHLRIEGRCRSAGDREFARALTATRGAALYEELVDRIAGHYVLRPDLGLLAARGLDNCRTAARNAVFGRTYGLRARAEEVAAWAGRLLALRSRVAEAATPEACADCLREVLAANAELLGLPDGALIVEMIHGAVEGLDGYSAFLAPEALRALRAEIDGEFVGLGIRVALRDAWPVVIEPIPEGPAAQVGIRAGDRVLAVDGHGMKGLSLEAAARHLHGPLHSRAVVEVLHEGEGTPVVLTVERQRVAIKSVSDVRVVGGRSRIGYLRVASFQKGTAEEVEQALNRLEASRIAGLILDLRGNPGGVLDAAVEVANAFVGRGVLVTTRGRAWGQSWTFRARSEGARPAYPMAVLVDEMSASASEILAAALQDHQRAVLVGARTYGKGSVQSLFKLGAGDVALRLTTARYYAPGGRCLDGSGLVPDLPVRLDAPGSTTRDLRGAEGGAVLDRQLAAALEHLEGRLASATAAAGAATRAPR